jgi:hypothetical protein
MVATAPNSRVLSTQDAAARPSSVISTRPFTRGSAEPDRLEGSRWLRRQNCRRAMQPQPDQLLTGHDFVDVGK